ncbi:MAG: sugar transferase [Bacteroidetes bacterium]|nr:sugar transferase [Bacteroidota bacterium]
MKRFFDIVLSIILILLFSPLLLLFSILIWKQDWHSPFYVADRVGRNENIFKMIKFRSMIVNADKSGVDSTSANDNRITSLGRFIRKYKIDELPNIFNIFLGQMSFVGPRPNVKRETDLYTTEEKILLSVRPGITDIASIVFSDEGNILENSKDPDLDYNQLIRPWKSRLGIFYVNNMTLLLDVKLIFLTAISIISKNFALKSVNKMLVKLSTDNKLIEISKRESQLIPHSPPGSDSIVTSRG